MASKSKGNNTAARKIELKQVVHNGIKIRYYNFGTLSFCLMCPRILGRGSIVVRGKTPDGSAEALYCSWGCSDTAVAG